MSIGSLHNKCCFIVKTEGDPKLGNYNPTYCGKPSTYTMIKDDDYNTVRDYSGFCQEHLTLIRSQPKSEDDFE